LIKCLSSIDLPVDAGDFALLSRRVVEAIRSSKEHSRYLRGLRSWVGFRQRGVPVKREPRHAGQSKYTLRRLLGLTFDGLFAFSLVPLRFAMLVGVLSMAAALLYVGYAAYAKVVLSQSPAGFTALIVAITFLAGVQIFFLGVVGEYVGRIYEEVKQRPQYIVREIIRGGQAWTRHMPSDTPNCTKDIGGGALGNASS
jgi:dolichol-phosphate mannosyltransferase